jgi:ABC-type branched-subunit amino acid transport system substrate-binding protein
MSVRAAAGRGARRGRLRAVAAVSATAMLLVACGNGDDNGADDDGDDNGEVALDEVEADVGVDVDEQVLRIATLDDLSGPAAAIGTPYAIGKDILVEQVNAGELDVLPEGWTIELEQRDVQYNPQEAVQAFNELSDDVLFFATVMGTPTTLPLVPISEQAGGVTIFPASLSSELAVNEYTPPIGAPYMVEAHHAVQHALDDDPDAQLGIVHQLDDYGEDGLNGFRDAAEYHDAEIVAEEGVAPGETDVTATISALQSAGATHVLLSVLPSTSGPVLGTAAQLGYEPIWYGNTPAWIDRFFDPETLPPPVYQNFRWVTGLAMWGDEELDGMEGFLDAYESYGADEHPPDFYILASYSQGKLALEAFSRALEQGDVTRDGYHEALRTIEGYDAEGLFPEAIDLETFPYATLTDTRVLSPGEDLESWEVLEDYRTPDSWEGIDE